eukprot:TRINITY_DN7393_c0_g5_i7.p1 TRINITY_DN7393_c0_g5~~TRINITY_DN7393_c0_g5_i7.p1  ORF type:complete len:270 (+),score=59.08 TRINITY_DN7393_c0_g5_i7:247-1056(+)
MRIFYLDKRDDALALQSGFRRAIEETSQLQSPNIAQHLDCFLDVFEAGDVRLHVVGEYFGGSSIGDLMQDGPIDELYIAVILKEALKGLVYLHNIRWLHKNLNASNIMISSTGVVKLVDARCHTHLRIGARALQPWWTAPEVMRGKDSSEAMDIWSLGISAIEMASGERPFSRIGALSFMHKMYDQRIWPGLEGNFSPKFKDFIEKCLSWDPKERPSVQDLLNHHFIANSSPASCLIDLLDRSTQRKADHLELDELKYETLGDNGWSFQ